MRVKVTLACTECKQRNYDTMKNKKNTPPFPQKRQKRLRTRQVGDEQVLQILQEAYSPQRNEVSRKENCYGKEREFRSC